MICHHRHFEFMSFLSLNLFAFVLASCDSFSSSFILFNLQGIPSLTMSLFLFDSAIDMGGSDSGGSIQQPLMDREVISIGGSSSKYTHHGASDNEFFSSERLRVSHCTRGGTSRLRGRAWPSVASLIREPVPITVIFPLSIFRGAWRSGGDVRVSPRVHCSHNIGSPSSPLPLLALNE